MKVVPFQAESAAEAVAQIRAQLGPEAIVLNVRQLPSSGLARLWQKPRIEVLACAPELAAADPAPDPLVELRQELASLKQRLPQPGGDRSGRIAPAAVPAIPDANSQGFAPGVSMPSTAGRLAEFAGAFGSLPASARDYGGWRVGPVLENMGFLPVYAQKVVDRLRAQHGQAAADSLGEELQLTRILLRQMWPADRGDAAGPAADRHVMVGPPGAGKTTCLCKWLVQTVLLEGRSARVWRLDGRTANAAESLSVFCDILGVPLDRAQPNGTEPFTEETLWIDLPGISWREPAAIQELAGQLQALVPAQLHLVLNAAYELPLLLAQLRAFAALPIADIIFTHLDDETRWGKLWNFVLGTNYTLRFLSAGQNIPGDFIPATPEQMVDHLFA